MVLRNELSTNQFMQSYNTGCKRKRTVISHIYFGRNFKQRNTRFLRSFTPLWNSLYIIYLTQPIKKLCGTLHWNVWGLPQSQTEHVICILSYELCLIFSLYSSMRPCFLMCNLYKHCWFWCCYIPKMLPFVEWCFWQHRTQYLSFIIN